MRFHVIALPHTQTARGFSACAFNEKVRKFCIMMKALEHTVYLYASEHNEAPCDEHIACISEAERVASLGGKHYTEASFDNTLPHWRAFNARAIMGIRARAEPRDFICVIGGLSHKPIADAFPGMMTVEFGIGYPGTFAKYRVWESYAWMHTCYGAANRNPAAIDGIWFDAVIPSYFEPEKFPFRLDKDDYYLFIGRMIERKGVHIASEICERAGKRLVLAGPGKPPRYGEHVGEVGPEQRGKLMAGAKALIMPTTYIEPFGSVAPEAMMCGTPVICTDWGAMTETVVQGVTGFRCRTMSEFTQALDDVADLNPMHIMQHAMERYSLDVCGKLYQSYFERLSTLWDAGWYSERNPAKTAVG